MEARVRLNYKEFALLITNAKKTTTHQQLTCRNTPNSVLKRMQRHFLKIPSLWKILEFQD